MFLLHHPRSMGQRVLVHHLVKRRNLQRRPFFSFLAPNDNNHSKQQTKEETDRLQREEQILTDETHYRMSLQHAHPLGPWQAILAAVKSHFQTQQPFRVLDLACGPRGQPGTTIDLHRACDMRYQMQLFIVRTLVPLHWRRWPLQTILPLLWTMPEIQKERTQ